MPRTEELVPGLIIPVHCQQQQVRPGPGAHAAAPGDGEKTLSVPQAAASTVQPPLPTQAGKHLAAASWGTSLLHVVLLPQLELGDTSMTSPFSQSPGTSWPSVISPPAQGQLPP